MADRIERKPTFGSNTDTFLIFYFDNPVLQVSIIDEAAFSVQWPTRISACRFISLCEDIRDPQQETLYWVGTRELPRSRKVPNFDEFKRRQDINKSAAAIFMQNGRIGLFWDISPIFHTEAFVGLRMETLDRPFIRKYFALTHERLNFLPPIVERRIARQLRDFSRR